MPIELPNLDDKTYAELVDEARASIPRIYPDWTDHNPSDPGIALVELLAWLTEMLIYRTGRIPEPSVRTFLRLLDINEQKSPTGPLDQELPLEEAIRSTVRALREPYRAVTAEDYEHLAMVEWGEEKPLLKRVRCVAERNLAGETPTAEAPGHVSLLVVPSLGEGASPWLVPSGDLLEEIKAFFDPRRLITTRFHAASPVYVPIDMTATLLLRDDARPEHVEPRARAALTGHFHPWTGGRDGGGWPFGRDVHVSEIYALLDGVPGVDFVKEVLLDAPAGPTGSRRVPATGKPSAIRLDPHELPRVEKGSITINLEERRAGL